MLKGVCVGISVSVLLVASVALACGAPPPPPSPGYAGTAVAERGGTLSVFSGNPNGYSWDRIQPTSTDRVHIADVPGTLTGSVETDARVNTAIAGQSGRVVELSAAGATVLSEASDAQTEAFGAALSNDLKWQVLTWNAPTQTIALFSEGDPGAFTEVSTLQADCGQARMLDLVIEDDGSLIGLCGSVALELNHGSLAKVDLPVAAASLARGTDGKAVAYGLAADGTQMVVMSHGASGWSTKGTFASPGAPDVVLALDETSVLVKQSGSYTAYTLSAGTWHASSALAGNLLVTSATGSPAQVFSGDYELFVNSTDGSANGPWTTSDLGAMGILPVAADNSTGNQAGYGCTIVGTGVPFALLAAMTLARMRRRKATR
jgi:hypothetical protein